MLIRVVVVLTCFGVGLWSLGEWLFDARVDPPSLSSQEDKPDASEFFTAVVSLVPLGVLTVASLYRLRQPSAKARRVQNVATLAFVALVLMTVNSIGAWLFPAALLAALAWLIALRQKPNLVY